MNRVLVLNISSSLLIPYFDIALKNVKSLKIVYPFSEVEYPVKTYFQLHIFTAAALDS